MKLPETKLNVKLIAFDLDDTLLTDKKIISPRTVSALKKAAEKGIYIVLCSGRAENGILPFVRQLNIAGSQQGRYLIAFNGASVFDLHLREQIYSNLVKPEILKFAYNEARKRGMASVVYESGVIYSWEDSDFARKDAELCNLEFKVVDDFEKFLENGFPKILISAEPEKVKEGIYKITFSTPGREFKIHTTDYSEVGQEVGLTFFPEDIHVMSRMVF